MTYTICCGEIIFFALSRFFRDDFFYSRVIGIAEQNWFCIELAYIQVFFQLLLALRERLFVNADNTLRVIFDGSTGDNSGECIAGLFLAIDVVRRFLIALKNSFFEK